MTTAVDKSPAYARLSAIATAGDYPPLLHHALGHDHLQLSKKTIRRWIEREELAVHRFGRALRIAENDLAAFLGRHRW